MATIAQLAVGVRNEAGPGSRAFNRDVGTMGRTAGRTTAEVGRLQTKLQATGATARSAGGQILAAFGVFGGLMVIGQATRAIAEFEETMALAGKVSRASGEQFARMAEQAKMLGATTRFTASEAADGLLFLARAGFEAEEAIAALPSTLDLAAAGVMGLGEAADLASNVVKQFGLEALDTVRVVDALIIVSNRANTNVSQLGEALKYAGPVAGAVGLSVEQTASALGALGDAGIQASLAGTNLRGIMSALLGPTSKAKSAIQKMGLSLEDLDVEKNGVLGVFEKFKQANLSAADAVAIFGRRNASAALVLTDSVGKMAALEAATIMASGEAAEMSNVMGNTLKGSLAALKSAFEGVMLASGDAGLAGALKATVDTATGVLRVFAGLGHTVERNETLIRSLAFAVEVLVARFVLLKAAMALRAFGALVTQLVAMGVAARAAGASLAAMGAKLAFATGGLSVITTGLALGVAALFDMARATDEQTARMKELDDATRSYGEALDRLNRQVGFEGRVAAQADALKEIVSTLQQAKSAMDAAGETQRKTFTEDEYLGSGMTRPRTVTRDVPTDEAVRFADTMLVLRKQAIAARTDILARFAEIQEAELAPRAEAIAMLRLLNDVKDITQQVTIGFGEGSEAVKEFLAPLKAADLHKTQEEIGKLGEQISAMAEASSEAALVPTVDPSAAMKPGGSSDFVKALRAPFEQFFEALKTTNQEINNQLRTQQQQQQLIRLEMEGQTREAFQLQAIFAAEQTARNNLVRLTNEQRNAIREGAGALFDAKTALEEQVEREREALRLEQEKTRELERQADLRKRAQTAFGDEVQQLAQSVARLRVELSQGAEAGQEFAEAQKMQEMFTKAATGASDEQIQKLTALQSQYANLREQQKVLQEQQKLQATVEQIGRSAEAAFSNMVISIVDGSKSAQDALKDFGKTIANLILQQIMALATQRLFAAAFGGMLGGVGGAAAGAYGAGGMGPPAFGKGGVFRHGTVVPYSYGGVVSSPTMFPMSGGRTGLMGESGPEAIMPLRRGADGRLGIEAKGSTQQKNVQINMTVNTPDANSFRRSKAQIASQLKAAQSDI